MLNDCGLNGIFDPKFYWVYLVSVVKGIGNLYIYANEKILFPELVFLLRETHDTYYISFLRRIRPNSGIKAKSNLVLTYADYECFLHRYYLMI